ncbi:MAG: single-stranded-DNA-specific exonuclease RecJ [Anaerovoracaceae bacterium]
MKEINPIIAELLKKRGIESEEEITEFLSDKPRKTYDPFLLLNMEQGVDIIMSAINERKRICIYGDYDTDGITSTSILLQFLRNFDIEADYYIPSRFEEGYGLNKAAILKIKENGVDLIITVDCGSVSYDEVEYAKSLGLDIVVTDHHSITDVVADCIVINPKNPSCTYPCKNLAGCGVAFKLAQGLQRRAGLPKKTVNELLDLVAVGTIGDIVPLTDENRTFVKYGMNIIKEGHRRGLKTLIESISLDVSKLKSDNVAFGIVPHLNAAGRMKTAGAGVELMQAKEPLEIKGIVDQLMENNRERKRVQEETFRLCEEIIEEEKYEDDLFLIINCPDAHEGIAGIVAGKIKDKYKKPAIILTETKDKSLKGTGRSIKSINLYNLLKGQESCFERFGGHAGACGLLMKPENLEAFREGIKKSVYEMYEEDPGLFDDETEADLYINASEISESLTEALESLEPFGSANEKPCFAVENMRIQGVQYMGAKKNHARFIARSPEGTAVNCVLFNRAEELSDMLCDGEDVVIFGSPEISEWNGRRNIQFMVKDLKKKN